MTNTATRLREAIAESPVRKIRAFHRAMKDKDVTGTTRSMIHRYLNKEDPVPPPLDFLTAAAEVTGARVAWLAFGDGERTEAAEALAREEGVSPRGSGSLGFDLVQAVYKGFDAVDPFRKNVSPAVRGGLVEAAVDLALVRLVEEGEAGLTETRVQQAGAEVALMLLKPLSGAEVKRGGVDFGRYASAMALTINLMVGVLEQPILDGDRPAEEQ